MKKLFAILMSVLMIACFMPTAAFADETKAAKIGTTEYETLDAAIQAVTDKTPTTIELLSNVTLGENEYYDVNGKDITINGNGHTIQTIAAGKGAFNHKDDSNLDGLLTGRLTINNTKFVGNNGGYAAIIGFDSLFAITLDNCTFTNMYTGVYANPRSKALAESQKLERITITNCTYSDTTWGYSIDDVTPDSLPYSQQATVAFENNTGLDADHEMELFSEQVAEVDGTRYKDFGAALNAADGKTLKLLADIEVKGAIKIEKNITIDLNEKTLTSAKGISLTSGKKLTVKDSSENGKLILNESSLTLTDSALKLESGTIEINPKNAGANTIVLLGDSNMTMSGGSIVAHDTGCFNLGYYGTQTIDITGGRLVCNDGITPVIGVSKFGTAPKVTIKIAGSAVVNMKPESMEANVLVTGLTDGDELLVTGGTFDVNPLDYTEASAKVYKTNAGLYQINDSTHSAGCNTWTLNTTGDNAGIYTESYVSRSSGSSSSTTTTDNVTNKTEDKTTDTGSTTETNKVATTTATVKAETKTAADGTKTTTATVDTTTASKIVEKAVENKSEEVVVNTATATTVTETAAGTKTEVALPEQTVKEIAEKTEAAVTIKSDAAEVKLDREAVKAVGEAAGTTGEVKLEVKTVAQNETKVEVDLKLVTSNGNVTDFKGGSVSVTVKLNAKLAAKPVVCVYIDDNGTYHKVKGVKNADGTYTFETGHFSTYAVMAEEEADEVIAEQTENVEKLVGDLNLKARSTKTEKENIKVTLTVDKDALKAIEDLGYTVKYKFYRSTKKAKSYKAKIEGTGKTYTNTAGTKGTKYYYKARVMVYDAQGALVAKSKLKQCKYACRKF